MTWHNQIVILKQQLQQLAAIIGSGLIQAIKPLVITINQALSGIIAFTQKVVNALGKIFGWEMEMSTSGISLDDVDIDSSGIDDVASGADDASKSLDKATTSAKKFKDQLQGFDKLNVLRTTKDTTSSPTGNNGGNNNNGTGTGVNPSSANQGEVSSALKRTKSLFESEIDNLYDLGKYISGVLTKALASIDWNKVYQAARNFGTGLANFLNGLIRPELFSAIGKTIAGGINTALHFLDSFGQTFDWGNFGKSLGVGLTTFLNTLDWKVALSAAKNWGKGLASAMNNFLMATSFDSIGKTFANLVNTAVTYALNYGLTFNFSLLGVKLANATNGALKNLDWESIKGAAHEWSTGLARTINAYLRKTDFSAIGSTIASLLNTAIQMFVDFGETFDAKLMGQKFADAVNAFFSDFSMGDLARGLNAWVHNLEDFLIEAARDIHWDQVFQGIYDFFSEIDIDTLLIIFGAINFMFGAKKLGKVAIAKAFLKSLFGGKAIADLGTLLIRFKEIAFDPLVGMGTPAFDVFASDLTDKLWETIYRFLPDGWKKKYDKFFQNVGKVLEMTFGRLIESITNVLKKVFGFENTKAMWDSAKEDFKKGGVYILKGIGEGFLTPISFLVEPIAQIFEGIFTEFKKAFGINSPAEKMKPIGKYIIEGILEGFKLPNIAGAIGVIINGIMGAWESFKGWWKSNATLSAIKAKVDDFSQGVKTKWNNVVSFWKGKSPLSKIKTTYEDIKGRVKGEWSKAQSFWKGKSPLAMVKGTYESIRDKVKGKWNETLSFWRGKSPLAMIKTTYENFKDKVSGAWNKVVSFWRGKSKLEKVKFTLENLRNLVQSAWNSAKNFVSSHLNLGTMRLGLKYPDIDIDVHYRSIAGISIPYPSVSWNWKSFASGGFLDQFKSFTMATLGENGVPEILGQVGGRPAVAGGQEITGIRDSVEATGYEQIALLRRQNQLLTQILNKEFGISKDEIFSAVRDKNSDYINRTGRSAFAT